MRGLATAATFGALWLAGCGQDNTPEPFASAEARPPAVASAVEAVAETDEDEGPGVDEGTLCAGAESVVFSCTLANGKIASVCGSNPEIEPAYAEYRLARQGNALEINLPDEGEKPVFATVAYSGGGAQELIYTRGEYRYVVFSSMTRNFKGPKGSGHDFEAGVAVLRGDKQVSKQMCVTPDDEDIILHDEAAVVVADDQDAYIYLE